jgi:hypothetical protein
VPEVQQAAASERARRIRSASRRASWSPSITATDRSKAVMVRPSRVVFTDPEELIEFTALMPLEPDPEVRTHTPELVAAMLAKNDQPHDSHVALLDALQHRGSGTLSATAEAEAGDPSLAARLACRLRRSWATEGVCRPRPS